MLYPMLLEASLKDYLWGGTRLKTKYGKKTELNKVAESWELSCHKDGKSIIANGEAAGQTLESWLDKQGKSVLGTRAEAFPYFPLLIKLIDAKGNLSVQVHPDNDYAMRVEGEYGKTEMWYIVECEPGASLLYGFKHKISREEFKKRIEENTLLEVCNRVPVHKGDVFFIDAGTLHAIGEGIVICEIQQNSNTTYRIYDYGRVGKDGKPRELHVGKAMDVTKLETPTRGNKALAHIDIIPGLRAELLAECEYFTVYHGSLDGVCQLQAGAESFQSLTVLEGDMKLSCGQDQLDLSIGRTVFLPAGIGTYQLSGTAEFILSKL